MNRSCEKIRQDEVGEGQRRGKTREAERISERNLGAVVHNEEGSTNAGTLGCLRPLSVLDAGVFAEENIKPDRTELLNRPAIGLSTAVGSLAALQVNLVEGAAAGIFGETFVQEYVALCEKFDLQKVNQTLNIQAGGWLFLRAVA